MGIILRGSILLAGILAVALPLGAQAPAAPSKPPEKKDAPKEVKLKAKRVWTEDDLSSLRRPVDTYMEQKEAIQQVAGPASTAQPAQTGQSEAEASPSEEAKPAKEVEDPNSAKALERRLKQWQAEVVRNDQQIDEARRVLSVITDKDRWETAKRRLDILEQNRIEIQSMIQETRGQLEQAKKQPRGAAGASPAPSEPGNPATPQPPL